MYSFQKSYTFQFATTIQLKSPHLKSSSKEISFPKQKCLPVITYPASPAANDIFPVHFLCTFTAEEWLFEEFLQVRDGNSGGAPRGKKNPSMVMWFFPGEKLR